MIDTEQVRKDFPMYRNGGGSGILSHFCKFNSIYIVIIEAFSKFHCYRLFNSV